MAGEVSNPGVELRDLIRQEIDKRLAAVDQVVLGTVSGVEARGEQWLALNGGGWAESTVETIIGSLDDFTVEARVSLWDWTPASGRTILQLRDATTTAWWALMVDPAGSLQVQYDNGAGGVQIISSSTFVFPNFSTKYIRVAFDRDNGGGLSRADFWTSDDGVTYTAHSFGTDTDENVFSTPTSGTAWIGKRVDGFPIQGNIHFVHLFTGIGSAKSEEPVMKFDANIYGFGADRGDFMDDGKGFRFTIRGSGVVQAETVEPLVLIDGMSISVPVVWAAQVHSQRPAVGQRVVLNGLRGGQQWAVVGVLQGNPYEEKTTRFTGQVFIDHFLQHLNFRETDDDSYPLKAWIVDVNGGLFRVLFADTTSGTTVFETPFWVEQNGVVHIDEWLSAGYLFMNARDGTNEGGEITLAGAGSHASVPLYMDRFQNDWRVVIDGQERLRIGPAGMWREGFQAFTYHDTVPYDAAGTFDFEKGDWPDLVAVMVELVGGGGGSGGAATTAAGEAAIGGSGGGGSYARSWEWATDLDTVEAVVVGAGGSAGAAGNNAGGAGGDSSFDTIPGGVVGKGGGAGGGSGAIAPLSGVPGTSGGSQTGSVGNLLVVEGDDGLQGFSLATTRQYVGGGGGSHWAGISSRSIVGSGGTNGGAGKLYGGGAFGGVNSQSQGTARSGAVGGHGLVLVHLFF